MAKKPRAEELAQELTELKEWARKSGEDELNNLKNIQLRLYVVEDLSKDVIEVLGSGLGIEPSFFRAHIVDYAGTMSATGGGTLQVLMWMADNRTGFSSAM